MYIYIYYYMYIYVIYIYINKYKVPLQPHPPSSKSRLYSSLCIYDNRSKEPPPPGFFFSIYYVPWSRTRSKRTPPEEPPPKLINFGGSSLGGVLFLQVFHLETTQPRKPPLRKLPRRGDFFRSKYPVEYTQSMYLYIDAVYVFMKRPSRIYTVHVFIHRCSLCVYEKTQSNIRSVCLYT